MGYLKKVGTSFIYIFFFIFIVTFLPGLPPYIEDRFQEYSIVSPVALKGDLAINNKLNDAEKLFLGQIHAPESFASYNGELYTGLQGDGVVKVTKNKIEPIVNFRNKSCEYIWQMAECGKPLGLAFDKSGNLYVSDPFHGIFKVDVKTGKYEKIVDVFKPIEGKVPKIANSLEVAANGDIYWTDSSTDFTLDDGIYTLLANPSGRLLRYNAATKQNQVLLRNLGFANGLKLSKNEDFLIVAETMQSRIVKYHLKGPKAGKDEIFVEGLPGFPDNIHSDGLDGFLVSLVTYIDEEHPQLSQSLTPHPWLRKMLIRLLALLEAPYKFLQEYYPNYYAGKFVSYVGSFPMMLWMLPDVVTVLRISEKGEILEAAYCNDARITSISSAFVNDGHLWLGSPFNDYLARIPLKTAFPKLASQGSIDSGVVYVVQPKTTSTPPTKDIPKPKTTPPTPKTTTSTTTTTPKPVKTSIPKTQEKQKTQQAKKPRERSASEL